MLPDEKWQLINFVSIEDSTLNPFVLDISGSMKKPVTDVQEAMRRRLGAASASKVTMHPERIGLKIKRFGIVVSLTLCAWACAKRNDYVDRFYEDLARTRLQGKWGFVDKSQKLIIPRQYEMVRSFSEGLAAVKIGNKWGYIDHAGKLVILPQFDEAKSFHGRFAVVSKWGKWCWIDKGGKTVAESEIDLIP